MLVPIKTSLLTSGASEIFGKLCLSTPIIKTIFFILVSVLGIHTSFTLLAQQIRIPFKAYLLISLLIMILCTLGVLWTQWPEIKKSTQKDYSTLLWLFLIGLVCAALNMFTHRASTDNYFYIPNAVYFLDHPTEPLDFVVHFVAGTTNEPIVSHSQGTSLSYDYFRAVLAYYLGGEFLAVYYLSGVVMAFLLPFAHYLPISQFVDSPKSAIIATLVSIALISISLQGRGFANFALRHAYMGKASLLSIGIPLFCGFSMTFFRRPVLKNWIILSACTMAFVGMTASASILLIVLAIVLLGSSITVSKLIDQGSLTLKMVIPHSLLYLASLWFLFVYMLFLYVQVKRSATSGNPFDLYGPTDFWDHLSFFSGTGFPLTLVLMGVSLILVITWVNGWQKKFILIWTALLVLLFVNPVSSQLIIDNLIPRNIYWRLLYLTPLPFASGIAVANLRLPSYGNQILSGTAFVCAILFYLLFNKAQGSLGFSIIKLPQEELQIAREIAAISPHGVMLAPRNLYGFIPMIDGFHPQIRTREDGNRFWFTKNASEMREHASLFAEGNPAFLKDFSQLLNKNIAETIVLNKIVFEDIHAEEVTNLLKKKGFLYQKAAGDYIIVWK